MTFHIDLITDFTLDRVHVLGSCPGWDLYVVCTVSCILDKDTLTTQVFKGGVMTHS